MNDFQEIRLSTHLAFPRVMPDDLICWDEYSARYIASDLEKYFDGKTVVVTHYSPSHKCLSAGYEYDLLSASYASNLYDLINKYSQEAWFYGHLHKLKQQKIGNTLVMNHPASYSGS